MTHAELEPLTSGIRVWADGHAFPDPHTWCGVARYLNRRTVEICLADHAPTLSEWHAIMNELARDGVTRLMFRRFKHGIESTRWLKVRCRDLQRGET